MNPVKHVIWDADGVLLDSFDVVLNVYAEIAKQASLPFDLTLAEKLLRENRTFGEIIKALWNVETKKDFEAASDNFTKISATPEFFNKVKLFDGIKNLLAQIENASIIQSVATTRDSRLTRDIFTNLRVTEFQYILGGNNKTTDKTDILNRLISLFPEIARKEYLFISDSPDDIKIGNELGLIAIGVGYGFSDLEHIELASPAFTAKTITDLRALIKTLAKITDNAIALSGAY